MKKIILLCAFLVLSFTIFAEERKSFNSIGFTPEVYSERYDSLLFYQNGYGMYFSTTTLDSNSPLTFLTLTTLTYMTDINATEGYVSVSLDAWGISAHSAFMLGVSPIVQRKLVMSVGVGPSLSFQNLFISEASATTGLYLGLSAKANINILTNEDWGFHLGALFGYDFLGYTSTSSRGQTFTAFGIMESIHFTPTIGVTYRPWR